MHSQVAIKTTLSDHYIVEFHTNQPEKFVKVVENCKDKGIEYGFHMLNFQDEKIDWEGLGEACDTDWEELLEGKEDGERESAFHDHCLEIAYEYVPKKTRPSTKGKKAHSQRPKNLNEEKV